jgi:hypothetical protein
MKNMLTFFNQIKIVKNELLFVNNQDLCLNNTILILNVVDHVLFF